MVLTSEIMESLTLLTTGLVLRERGLGSGVSSMITWVK